jgi:hypothetical protein
VAVIEGAQSRSGGLQNAGAPAAGTDEVQTLTIGGTPTGGTFRLSYDGRKTTDIPWANVNATLIASIDAALEALPNLGAGAVVTAVGSMTAGIGTATILVERNDLTGTAPTVAVAETTPGVDQTGRGAAKGTLLADVTNGILYINTGTADAPTWTKVGTQT